MPCLLSCPGYEMPQFAKEPDFAQQKPEKSRENDDNRNAVYHNADKNHRDTAQERPKRTE